jgi:hypothetical protein
MSKALPSRNIARKSLTNTASLLEKPKTCKCKYLRTGKKYQLQNFSFVAPKSNVSMQVPITN